MSFPLPQGTLIPGVSYPGLTNGVISFTYTCLHGISPSKAILVCNPLATSPHPYGTLYFADGKFGMGLPNCRLSRVTPQRGVSGATTTIELEDRRWTWANGTFPKGGGHYNQVDPHGKLIPWTIRSPIELAALCFQALGERQFLITGLPRGLTKRDGRRISRYLKTGENYPISAANPPTNWEGITPAAALAELCDRFSCRVIYQPTLDRFLIARIGDGRPLIPKGSLHQTSAAVDPIAAPIAVGVRGAASQFQMRLALEPVGRDWNDCYESLEQLSYAPTPDAVNQVQITDCIVNPVGDAAAMVITVEIDGVSFTGSGVTALYNELNRRPDFINGPCTATNPDAKTIRLTGKTYRPFSVQCKNAAGSTTRSRFDAKLIQGTKKLIPDWTRAVPPWFPGINPTDRLSIVEARSLAQSSVWRCFRVIDEDVSVAHRNAFLRKLGKSPQFKPITVPGYGVIRNRRQLAITDYKVAQIVPGPRVEGIVVRGQQELEGAGLLPEYYNGYARNQRAVCYGTYAAGIGGLIWNTRAGCNNGPMAKLKVTFSVDEFNQVITFGESIYRLIDFGGYGGYCDPELILECAVSVRDPDEWAFVRPTYVREIVGGVGQPEYQIREDVIANFIGIYRDNNGTMKLDGSFVIPEPAGLVTVNENGIVQQVNQLVKTVRPPEDADGVYRAETYVQAMAAKYLPSVSQVQTWNGVVKISPDGLVQQVSWQIGPSGIFTTASTNSESSPFMPNYASRRMRENLAADPKAALANTRDLSVLGAGAAAGFGGIVAANRILKVGGS